jgi:site-specific recombinase XerD
MSKLKVSFYLKNDKQKNNESAIYAKIKLGSSTSTLATGKYICPIRWKKTNMLLQAKRINTEVSLKNHIYDIPMKIADIYHNLNSNKSKILSATDLKEAYTGKTNSDGKMTLLKLFNYHNLHFKKRVEKKEVSHETLEKYERIEKIMKDFIRQKYNKKDIPIQSINSKFIYSFDDYLRYERPNGNSKGISNNTAVKYFSNIKSIMNYCIRNEYIIHNPFQLYNKKLEEVETVFLTKTELEVIEALTFSTPRLNTVRDIFLFSCYTSYAPVDAMRLTWDDIEKESDGDLWIRINRQKSGVKSDIVAIPPVIRIINKYIDDPRCVNDKRLLPNYSNQKMNEYLKEIGELAGLKKKLTWYVSRHTFGTTVCLDNNIPLEHVSKMMGHKKITQTQHYAKLLDGSIKKQANKLKEIYSK